MDPTTGKIPGEHVSAKKVRLAAEACGFECWSVQGEIYTREATYYASTTDKYKEGDLKAPAKDFKRWRLRGRHMAIPDKLAFDCSWADGFMGGRIIDPVGKEFDVRSNYYYGPGEIKAYGYTKEYAEKEGQERTARYSGDTNLYNRWRVNAFGELTEWMDELIDLLKVDYPKITTKKKEAKTEEDLMHELLNPKIDYSL